MFDTSTQIVDIIIENSYSNKDVDLNRISEKGFTSKERSSRFSWLRFVDSSKYFEKI